MILQALDYLSYYIGGPATVFMSTLLFVIILRIGIAFVFKIFRLNIDYNTIPAKSRSYSKDKVHIKTLYDD